MRKTVNRKRKLVMIEEPSIDLLIAKEFKKIVELHNETKKKFEEILAAAEEDRLKDVEWRKEHDKLMLEIELARKKAKYVTEVYAELEKDDE